MFEPVINLKVDHKWETKRKKSCLEKKVAPKEKSRAKEKKSHQRKKSMHLWYNAYTPACISICACVWHQTWQLNSNITKCYDLGITSKVVPFSHNYLTNDTVIAKSASIKYLGVTITHNLNWNQHCDNICSKANSTLGLLRRVLRIVPRMSNPRHTLPLYVLN